MGFDKRAGVTNFQFGFANTPNRDAKESFCQVCLKTKPIKEFVWRGMACWHKMCKGCTGDYKKGASLVVTVEKLKQGIENALAERWDAKVALEKHDLNDADLNALCTTVVLCTRRIADFEERIELESFGQAEDDDV